MATFSRRRVLGAGGALVGAAAVGATMGSAAGASTDGDWISAGGSVPEETKSLDRLYAEARREGGKLVIYAGGDTADQQDATKQAFLSQFPEIDLALIVDYS